MSTERHNVGETEIKMTIEMTIILQEIPASTGNETTVEKEVTWLLIVGQIKENRKTITFKPLRGIHILWRSSIREQRRRYQRMVRI